MPTWESFAGFNRTGPTVEWRVTREGGSEVPFATIHRWSVSTGDTPRDEVEVLVVEKVGQISAWDGCAVGYVVATGNPDANEQARRVADEAARGFDCGMDQPAVHAGSVPLPDVTRGDQYQRP
ncbi:hypothetical protein [Chelativorans salis]|uniref:hypothetical protein n=1 Tax=Chelativorans salis TaxID=2978478 RepID=UPI0028CB70C0|nr:hypothetical protein [Chelativorans sp. EGI FJ00035]